MDNYTKSDLRYVIIVNKKNKCWNTRNTWDQLVSHETLQSYKKKVALKNIYPTQTDKTANFIFTDIFINDTFAVRVL